MKHASLGQGVKILQMIVDKGMPLDQLQALCERGFISDLLDANANEINRDELRVALGLMRKFTVTVKRSSSTREAAYRFMRGSSEVPPTHLHDLPADDPQARPEMVCVGMIRVPGLHVTAADAQDYIRSKGYRPATLRESIALMEFVRDGYVISVAHDVPNWVQVGRWPVVAHEHFPYIRKSHGPWLGKEARFVCVLDADREQGYYE